MPLIVPKDLPCVERLRREGIPLLEAVPPGVYPLRILLLNLMPQKEAAEMEYYRVLSYSTLYVQIIPAKMSNLKYKNTPQAYMDRFYTDIEDLHSEHFDGMIITGAPLEDMLFEEVTYWEQLKSVFRWTRIHVRTTLFICWGAQAALYALYRVPKFWLHHKMFGVYEQTPKDLTLPIFRGFDSHFNMPQSRHTEVRLEDMQYVKELDVLAESPISGAAIISAFEGREFFLTGHLEYSPDRLAFEYNRDIGKGLPISPPYHYFEDDDPKKPIRVSWRAHAYLFYANWLKYYVNNPELEKIPIQ
jgi:homoserine O-succinyltransferase